MKQYILSIDWDFFFDEPWVRFDWGTRENAFFLGKVWPLRWNPETAKIRPEGHESFWDKVPKPSSVFAGESHLFVYDLFATMKCRGVRVFHFDWHSDCYKRETGIIDCANWLKALLDLKKTWRATWVQPRIDDGYPPVDGVKRVAFDSLKLPAGKPLLAYVARSGAWVPPWCDPAFFTFVGKYDYLPSWFKLRNRWDPEMKEACIRTFNATQEAIKQLKKKITASKLKGVELGNVGITQVK